MISIMSDNKVVGIKWIPFSDGATTCIIDNDLELIVERYICLAVDPRTQVSKVMEEIELVCSAIEGHPGIMIRDTAQIKLSIPYLPYGRADRRFEPGAAEGLAMFQSRLIDLGFDVVYVNDPHNVDALDPDINWEIKDQLQCFKDAYGRAASRRYAYDYVLAPDKGATEKAQTIADWLETPMVQAKKVRDVTTGKIKSLEVPTLPSGSRVIVVDDICDGGGTFIPIADQLAAMGCVADVYWTHLIGARGLDLFRGKFRHIYYHNLAGTHTRMEDVRDFNEGIILK